VDHLHGFKGTGDFENYTYILQVYSVYESCTEPLTERKVGMFSEIRKKHVILRRKYHVNTIPEEKKNVASQIWIH